MTEQLDCSKDKFLSLTELRHQKKLLLDLFLPVLPALKQNLITTHTGRLMETN